VAAAVLLALLAVVGCGGTTSSPAVPEERGLHADEAEELAVMRFQNYRDGVLGGRIELPSSGGMTATVAVDYRAHHGLGVITGGAPAGASPDAANDAAPALFAWDGSQVFSALGAADDPFGGKLPPRHRWSRAALNPTAPVDNFLLLLLQLGSDRPENPQLLQQSSARFLRSDEVDGVPVKVFAGPAPADGDTTQTRTRYWLDEDGFMRRFEVGVKDGEYDRFTVEQRPAPALPDLVTKLFAGSDQP